MGLHCDGHFITLQFLPSFARNMCRRGVGLGSAKGETGMHRSRINGILIDCNTDDIQAAARFWAEALGRPIDPDHPGTRGNYVMLETPPDELSVQIQRVSHESRVHLDIETDDIA